MQLKQHRKMMLAITIEGNETLWDVGFREMVYTWN